MSSVQVPTSVLSTKVQTNYRLLLFSSLCSRVVSELRASAEGEGGGARQLGGGLEEARGAAQGGAGAAGGQVWNSPLLTCA